MPVKKANNGTYTVDISLGYDNLTNKRIRTTRRGIKILKEGKEIERKLLNENDLDNFNTKKKFIDIANEYLNNSATMDKPNSQIKKSNVFKNYITPFFNNTYINNISVKEASEFKEFLINQNISNNYRRYILAMMSSFMDYAVRLGYINKNPFKQIINFKKEKVTMKYWTSEEFNKFIFTVDNIMYKTMFWLLFYSGMQKGEVLGLPWNDIDLISKTININKTCSYIAHKGYMITSPKTPESKRQLYINNKTVEILKEYKEHVIKYFNHFENDQIFFMNGDLPPKETIRRQWHSYQRKAKVKEIRLHDLRHSHVALLIYLKQDALSIKKRLGHSDITITLNNYGHLYDDVQKELVDKLDNI